jgi:hypothetical protein
MYTGVDWTRLKYYDDASLDQNADLLKHVLDEGLFYEINELKDLPLNTETKSWEILVSWSGIEDIENTWITLIHLWKGISQLIYQFMVSITNNSFAKKKLKQQGTKV